MSLIITSSTQDRYVDTDFAVENAHSYKNYMINSIQIPKRSAVCVQSVKFSRRGNFVIKNDDYYGYFLNSGAHDGLGDITEKNPMTPLEFTFKPGSYTVKQFPAIIKDAINPVINFHPDFEDVVTETQHTSEKWDGFKLTTFQKDRPVDAVEKLLAYPIISLNDDEGLTGNGQLPYNRPAGGVATPMWDGGYMNAQSNVPFTANIECYEYGASGGSFKSAQGDGNGMTYAYFPTMPVSLQKGGYSFECNKYKGTTEPSRTDTSYMWVSSLCRPMAVGYDAIDNADGGLWRDHHTVGAMAPSLLLNNVGPSSQKNGNWTQFGDFWCSSRIQTGNGKYFLRVGYFGRKPGALGVAPLDNNVKNDSPFFFMNNNKKGTGGPVSAPTEIEYWKVTGTNVKTTGPAPGFTDGAYDMGLNANAYKGFRWEVSGEVVRLFAIKADDTEDYVIDIDRDTDNKFPVIKQTQVRLYPKLNIQNEIEGQDTSSLLIKTFLGRDMSSHDAYDLSIDHFGDGFYENNLGLGLKSMEVDRRGFSDPNWVYTPAALLATDIIPYTQQYIMEPTNAVLPEFLTSLPEANIMELLGFQKAFVIGVTDGARRGGFNITSSVVPSTTAEHSLFIRCPTLTQQCVNFGKGSISKILHHIPQFDNTGKSTGSLFFENANPMYLRLGNTEEITLNELQIDIVDRNEQFAYELDGSTIVVLHIKPESQI